MLNFDEPGNFHLTGLAPGGPKIDQDYFALVLRERKIFAFEIFKGDFWSGLGRSIGLTGRIACGEADYAFARLAGGVVGYVGGGENRNDRDDCQ